MAALPGGTRTFARVGLLLGVLAGCGDQIGPLGVYLGSPEAVVTQVVVTVEAPGRPDIHQLKIHRSVAGRDKTSNAPEVPGGPITMPTTFTVVAPDATGVILVEVDGLGANGQPVGRGRSTAELIPQGRAAMRITLGAPCDSDQACSNGVFCDGPELCKDGVCQDALGEDKPCQRSPISCLQVECVEAARSCTTTQQHALCPKIPDGHGGLDDAYCDVLLGCVRGQSCALDGDCQDPLSCNGEERCVSGRCLPGVPPTTDDGNQCTVDACVEVPVSGEHVLHINQADGNACTTGGTARSICLKGRCATSFCGDAFVDVSQNEECDSGDGANSDTEPDTCRRNCKLPTCGDNVVDLGEQCDLGQDMSQTACLPGCLTNVCGDGVVHVGVEACDDGNLSNADACLTNCVANICGDGIKNALAEECDDGNDVDLDSCRTSCVLPVCGDRVVDLGEQCDDGNDAANPACLDGCVKNTCGDGVLNTGVEECDDGNTSNADGCLATCVKNVCGDGVLNPAAEACDDGNRENLDQCRNLCVLPTCGDGLVDLGEQCDDANNAQDTRCLAGCILNTCGDGTLDVGVEGCDDGNDSNADGCLATCIPNTCGDGFRNRALEDCDDGNRVDSDFCRNSCVVGVCGDGVRNALVEACDDGNRASGDGCRADCGKTEVCGDGLVDQGEHCDDANLNPNDGCDTCHTGTFPAQVVTGFGPSGADPERVAFRTMVSAALDRAGNIYTADFDAQRVWRLDRRSSRATPAAGIGALGATGTSGIAVRLTVANPYGMAVDASGNLFIASAGHAVIYKVDLRGQMTVVAGYLGFQGDSAEGTVTSNFNLIRVPRGLTVDRRGNVYFAESSFSRIKKLTPNGVLTTYAGYVSGSFGFLGDGGPANLAALNVPIGIAMDAQDNLYIADRDNNRIRRVGVDGTITTVVGTGLSNRGPDGLDALATNIDHPVGVALGPNGEIYFSEPGTCVVRKVGVDGKVRPVAGTGVCGVQGPDGFPATSTIIGPVEQLAVDVDGQVLISTSNALRRVEIDGTIQSIFGSVPPSYRDFVDGTPGNAVPLNTMADVEAHPAGGLVFSSAILNAVLRLLPDGSVQHLAGTFTSDGFTGDNGPALDATFAKPEGVAVAPDGTVFLVDRVNQRVRRVDGTTGVVTTVAGTGTAGFLGEGIPALQANFQDPTELELDAAGNLYISDTGNHRVRMVDTAGVIHTVAGTGTAGGLGDGQVATNAQLSSPGGVAVDVMGNLYVADTGNHVVRFIDANTHIITRVAGTGTAGFTASGAAALSTALNAPRGVELEANGTLWIADTGNSVLRRLESNGTLTIQAGNGAFSTNSAPGYTPAITSPLGSPRNMAFLGNKVVFTDGSQSALRAFIPGGITEQLAGGFLIGEGKLGFATLRSPAAVLAPFGIHPWFLLDDNTVRALDETNNRLTTLAFNPYGRPFLEQPASGAPSLHTAMTTDTLNDMTRDPDTGAIYLVGSRQSVLYKLRLVDPAQPDSWVVSVLTGTLGSTALFADGTLDEARFFLPAGIAWDQAHHRLIVADRGNHLIRAVDEANNRVTTLCGVPGARGDYANGVPALEAILDQPTAVALGPDGSIYFTEIGSNHVRRIPADGSTVDTVLGDGSAGSGGQGSPARFFPVAQPFGLTVDKYGNVFVTSVNAVRRVAAGNDGVATGDDTVTTIYGLPPRDTFPESVTNCLSAVTAHPDGHTLMLLDACRNYAIRLTSVRAP